MESRRILFFAWPLGAGHTGRSLAVAKILAERGHSCIFAEDATDGLVSREGFAVARESHNRHRVKPSSSGYNVVPSLDACFASVGYYHPDRIRPHLDEDLALIREVKADLVVTHMQPTSVIAARLERLPTVSIADGDFLRPGPCSWMPWLPQHAIPRLVPFGSCLPAFNQILENANLSAIANIAELMWADAVLVGGTPGTDPVEARLNLQSSLDFVGPLLWDPNESEVAAKLANFGRDRRRIYVTGGSGEIVSRKMAEAAAALAEEKSWAIFLAAGYRVKTFEISANLLVNTFGGIRPALDWCDIVVCHGGHSTVMGALATGKPSIVIPAMSETECNGRLMVEQNGAGLLLSKTVWLDSNACLEMQGRYGGSTEPVTAASLARAIDELMIDRSYKSAAETVASEMAPWIARSREAIVTAVERLL